MQLSTAPLVVTAEYLRLRYGRSRSEHRNTSIQSKVNNKSAASGKLDRVTTCFVTLRRYVQRNSLSVLGFKVSCAIYGRRIHHPGAQLARPKLVMVTRGVRFSRSGNFTGTFLCYLHGDGPVIPTSGTQMRLLFANTYVILANEVPKWQIGFPVLVKPTCSPLPFFGLSPMVSPKRC